MSGHALTKLLLQGLIVTVTTIGGGLGMMRVGQKVVYPRYRTMKRVVPEEDDSPALRMGFLFGLASGLAGLGLGVWGARKIIP